MALKEIQDLWLNNIAVIATDNTMVVACIKEKGAMKSGPLWALIWRILAWYSRKRVTSPTHSRWLNVLADKLSSLSQTRQSRQKGPSCQSFSKQYYSGGTSPKWACFCHLAQQQTASTCITGARPKWPQLVSPGTSPKWACFCHLAQQQTASTCITGARPPIWTMMQ